MQMQAQAGSPSQAAGNRDDRIWAALAHGSAFFVFFGPIVPLIVWFTQRKKSASAAFHALQAMIYQSLFFWTWVLLIPLLMVVIVLIVLVVMIPLAREPHNELLVGLLPQLLIWGTMIGTFLLYAGIGLWGAVASLMGRDFRYPFFGDRMARSLDYHGAGTTALLEDKEEHVVGAVCHSTAALLMWGLLTPIIAWITQHERSKFLRFQAMQAVIYQAIGLIAYLAFMVLDFAFIFGSMGLAIFASAPGSSSSAAPAWLGVAVLPFLVVMCLFALGGPIYQILAFVAAVRVLNGHDFHYPILGNLLAAKLNPAEAK